MGLASARRGHHADKSIGIDLGETIFHFVALGSRCQVVVHKNFSRSQLLAISRIRPMSNVRQ
jgi:hypothetical protein